MSELWLVLWEQLSTVLILLAIGLTGSLIWWRRQRDNLWAWSPLAVSLVWGVLSIAPPSLFNRSAAVLAIMTSLVFFYLFWRLVKAVETIADALADE